MQTSRIVDEEKKEKIREEKIRKNKKKNKKKNKRKIRKTMPWYAFKEEKENQ